MSASFSKTAIMATARSVDNPAGPSIPRNPLSDIFNPQDSEELDLATRNETFIQKAIRGIVFPLVENATLDESSQVYHIQGSQMLY